MMVTETSNKSFSKAEANDLLYDFIRRHFDTKKFEIRANVSSKVGILDYVVYNSHTKLPHLVGISCKSTFDPKNLEPAASAESFKIISAYIKLLNKEFGRDLNLVEIAFVGTYFHAKGIKGNDFANVTLDQNSVQDDDTEKVVDSEENEDEGDEGEEEEDYCSKDDTKKIMFSILEDYFKEEEFEIRENVDNGAGVIDYIIYNKETGLPHLMGMAEATIVKMNEDVEANEELFEIMAANNKLLNSKFKKKLHIGKLVFKGPFCFERDIEDSDLAEMLTAYKDALDDLAEKYYSKEEANEVLLNLLENYFEDADKFEIRKEVTTEAGVVDYIVYNKETKLPHLIGLAEEGMKNPSDGIVEANEELFDTITAITKLLSSDFKQDLQIEKLVFKGPYCFSRDVEDEDLAEILLEYNYTSDEKVEKFYSKANASEVLFNLLENYFEDTSKFEIRKDVVTDVGIIDCIVYNKKTGLPHLMGMAGEGIENPSNGTVEPNEGLFGVLSANNILLNLEFGQELQIEKLVFKGPYCFSRDVEDEELDEILMDYIYMPDDDDDDDDNKEERLFSKEEANEELAKLVEAFFADSDKFEIRKDVTTKAGVVDYIVYNSETKLPHFIGIAEAGIKNPSDGSSPEFDEMFDTIASINTSLNQEFNRDLKTIKFAYKGPYLNVKDLKDDNLDNIYLDHNNLPVNNIELSLTELYGGTKVEKLVINRPNKNGNKPNSKPEKPSKKPNTKPEKDGKKPSTKPEKDGKKTKPGKGGKKPGKLVGASEGNEENDENSTVKKPVKSGRKPTKPVKTGKKPSKHVEENSEQVEEKPARRRPSKKTAAINN